ncbi:MAG: formyltetrahydrofolate-dependent phosphoribosylglycinamide formyltransferase [Proteobacteria bacterium]|nr:formyltetrahydrofolate-dependent phosphoribosylglycinamide formyltransferase [Pseudomonadota bacterium]
MKKLLILISGQGSNLEALMAARQAGDLPVDIVAVISNRPQAAGLEKAAAAGIETRVVKHTDYPEREQFDAALAAAIDAYAPDVIALAGFMRILTDGFVRRYEGRMINIHPSLLPSFPGLNTHQRALDEGVRIHGCTVHFVTPQLDHGPIIVQAAVQVRDDDDAQTLAVRVLQAEHRIYPLAVRWLAEGRLHREGQRVKINVPIREAAPLIVPVSG